MNDLMQNRGEFARAIANRKYEAGPDGILFPQQHVMVAGVFSLQHRNRKGELLGQDISPNIIPTEGLNHILSVIVAGGTQVNPWYVALFEANVTPGATLTAATFTSVTTECTAYDETTRVAYVEGSVAAGAVDNAASRAVFTMNATKTIYGGALLSASAKSATTGTLLAAAKFSASRAVVDDDELAVKYSLSATST